MALTINHQTNDISASSGSMTLDGAAVGGGGADLYAAETTGATDPTASGTESIAIGSDARSTGVGSIAIGKDTYSTGEGSIGIGIGVYSNSYGIRGIAIGNRASVSQTNGLAVGYNSTAGNASIAVGSGNTASEMQSMVVGNDCTADHRWAMLFGQDTRSRTRASLSIKPSYNQQFNKFFLARQTSDATPAVLQSTSPFVFSAGSDNQINIPDRCLYAFKGIVAARGNPYSPNTDCAAWEVKGMLRRESGASTTTLVNSTTSALTSNSPSWSFALSVDTTIGCMVVTVTGQASTTINWSAVIDAYEV